MTPDKPTKPYDAVTDWRLNQIEQDLHRVAGDLRKLAASVTDNNDFINQIRGAVNAIKWLITAGLVGLVIALGKYLAGG